MRCPQCTKLLVVVELATMHELLIRIKGGADREQDCVDLVAGSAAFKRHRFLKRAISSYTRFSSSRPPCGVVVLFGLAMEVAVGCIMLISLSAFQLVSLNHICEVVSCNAYSTGIAFTALRAQ